MTRRRALVAALGAALLAVPLSPAVPGVAAGADDDASPLRVLLVGDSVTQGSAGDWTWRYRLWRHLTDGGTAVDFVGPYDDLFDHLRRRPGDQSYNEPAFDRDHAARWGMALASPANDIGDLVLTYDPDVIVEALGVNDLTFHKHDPVTVADDLRRFVADVRAADPEVDLVLGRMPQTWYRDVPAFNALVDEVASELDQELSRVVVAELDEGFTRRVHTWDSAHANAQGEVQIAAAVADALAELGVAETFPQPLPTVPLGPRRPPALAATATDGGVTLTWDGPPGADREIVWWRDVTAGEDWQQLSDDVPEPLEGAFEIDGLTNGNDYAFMLQPAKGYWAAAPDVRSNVELVRPLPPLPGRALVPSAWSPRRDRVRVMGTAVPGATHYRVEVAPLRSCRRGAVRPARSLSGLTRPQVGFTTRAAAARVRLTALNLAGSGPSSPWSQCLRVR